MSKPSKPELVYFNVRARGEATRLIFAFVGEEYADTRVPMEEWPNMKPKMPFGFLPVLRVDGEEISQSMAIARHLARKYDLYGANDNEKVRVDQVLDTLVDIMDQVIKFFFMEDGKEKAELKKKYEEEYAPKMLGYLDKFASKNTVKGGKGHFVGDKISVADIALVSFSEFLVSNADRIKKHTHLANILNNTKEHPKIKEWIKKCPKTPY